MRIKEIEIQLRNKKTIKITPTQIQNLIQNIFKQVSEQRDSINRIEYTSQYKEKIIRHIDRMEDYMTYWYKVNTSNNKLPVYLTLSLNAGVMDFAIRIEEDINKYNNIITVTLLDDESKSVNKMTIQDFVSLASMSQIEDNSLLYKEKNENKRYIITLFKNTQEKVEKDHITTKNKNMITLCINTLRSDLELE